MTAAALGRGESTYPTEICPSCRSRIIVAHTNPGHRTDKSITVDATPTDDGLLLLSRDTTIPIRRGQPVPIRATTLRPAQATGARRAGEVLYRLHSRTCR